MAVGAAFPCQQPPSRDGAVLSPSQLGCAAPSLSRSSHEHLGFSSRQGSVG